MEKIYNARSIEESIYQDWEERGYFKLKEDKRKEPFCIMIPPPNVTGTLHMGHAFQQTIMDTIIRYQRMQGKNTLWQTGIDHAGIATQMVVERRMMQEEGKTRYDYDRSSFINKILDWKAKSSNTMTYQMKRLGNSLDWDRERFTLDTGFSVAVREAFIRLYKEGLIYRSKRLVNWDTKLCTAISDLEIENRELERPMWYIRYPLADNKKTYEGKGYIVIATTRPETLFGDTGVAVNPEDLRYQNLIGKFAILPLINRRIPIIGDKDADISKGTGCVKITPAHDFDDYKIGCRHALPMISIMTFDGKIRESAQIFDSMGNSSDIYSKKIPVQFQNLDRFAARKAVISAINALGLLEQVTIHRSNVPHSDRGDVIIEPMLTDQWFLRVKPLAKLAIEAVRNGDIRFIPKQYENIYFSWMRDIQDWCISRQIWWGHRIPVWYDEERNIYVGHSEQEVRKENSFDETVYLCQDEDVLDTWFSSSLWTFATLGWPRNTDFLRQFHPTSVIVSGFDIIFFWIARMIMMSMHFIKDINGKPQIPFKIVYITGLVRDDEGQKMSKSKGNIVDPLDIIDGISLQDLLYKRVENTMHPQLADKIRKRTKKQFPKGIQAHGSDALRFTLASLASTGRDIHLDMKRLAGYRNFCNKLWNASRFVLMHTENQDCGFNGGEKILSPIDRWILSEFNMTVREYRKALDNFRFDIASGILYEFVWNQFCDWYLEFTKQIMRNGDENELRGTRNTLISVLESLLRLAHPIIPFITEAIWKKVKIIPYIHADSIVLQPFPTPDYSQVDEQVLTDIEWLKQVIVAIRNVRIEMNIAANKPIELSLRNCSDDAIRRVAENRLVLQGVAHLKNVSILTNKETILPFIIKVIDDTELLVPIIGEGIDKDRILNSLGKEILKIEAIINRIEAKLINEKFVPSLPETFLTKEEKEKLFSYKTIKKNLINQQSIIESF